MYLTKEGKKAYMEHAAHCEACANVEAGAPDARRCSIGFRLVLNAIEESPAALSAPPSKH